jgi:hypothetical protein
MLNKELELLTSYAKYLIEYLESGDLNTEKENQ